MKKVKKFKEFISEKFEIDTSTNEFATLIVTHECNRDCVFCIDKYRGNVEYITIPTVIKHLKYAKSLGIKDILLVGGEPTLHPDIVEIARMVKEYGFNCILTTNYGYPDVVKKLDGIVDSFNISYYGGSNIPNQSNFKSDITINALIHKRQLSTKLELDKFIDKYKSYGDLKFSTLSVCNEWTKKNQKVDYLDELPGKRVVLFNEIEGIIYRGFIIKRHDRIINSSAHQSLKLHVDGKTSNSWDRK